MRQPTNWMVLTSIGQEEDHLVAPSAFCLPLAFSSVSISLSSPSQAIIWLAGWWLGNPLLKRRVLLWGHMPLPSIHPPANQLAGSMYAFDIDWSRGGLVSPPLSPISLYLFVADWLLQYSTYCTIGQLDGPACYQPQNKVKEWIARLAQLGINRQPRGLPGAPSPLIRIIDGTSSLSLSLSHLSIHPTLAWLG